MSSMTTLPNVEHERNSETTGGKVSLDDETSSLNILDGQMVLDQNTNITTTGRPSLVIGDEGGTESNGLACDNCKMKHHRAVLKCNDCGGLQLCKDCSRMLHNSSTSCRHSLEFLPEVISEKENTGLTVNNCDLKLSTESKTLTNGIHSDTEEDDVQSILLVDGDEKLQVSSASELLVLLHCSQQTRTKVISIFGNTGDGKSHTLNHTFFGGREVFSTSNCQQSCTIGVWAAYNKNINALILDTEGLLGISDNASKRMRLLLKILAISDVVIYRTRAERLHSDMFTFLGDASEAYMKYFSKDLKCVQEKCRMDGPLCSLGPAIVIFQETHHTVPLGSEEQRETEGATKSGDEIVRDHFVNVGRDVQAFSSISYVGTQTETPPTDFSGLMKEVKLHLKNSSVRSARSLQIIFDAFLVLNEKFAGDIEGETRNSFPDEYFTCSVRCQSCSIRCQCSMSHEKDGAPHASLARCKYQAQFDNRRLLCRMCYDRGVESLVFPKTASSVDTAWLGFAKYAWSGYVLECPECGVIYRSRQYWYGNRDPVETAVRTEIRHHWPGTSLKHGSQNAARRLLDGVSVIAEKIGSVSAKPTKVVSNWVTDKVAPAYWVPNFQILECRSCGHDFDDFETKHHCRLCGQGFCGECTTNRMPVPERGWGDEPVRVCDACFKTADEARKLTPSNDHYDVSGLLEAIEDDPALETGSLVAVRSTENIPSQCLPELVTSRRVTETVQSTLSYISSSLEYPRELMVDVVRPSYWVPDSDIVQCQSCQKQFTGNESKHHCRSCGHGFCHDCSQSRFPVPSRGWDYPVRVCDECVKKGCPL